jgi:hypothetical protein
VPAAFFLSAWCIAETLVALLKHGSGRTRPAALNLALGNTALTGVRRELPHMQVRVHAHIDQRIRAPGALQI